MGYPIWLTGSGDPIETRIHDLGRISGLDFFSLQLRAIDSAFTGTISYNVISGKFVNFFKAYKVANTTNIIINSLKKFPTFNSICF